MISESVLDAALKELFDLSPVPFSISTIDHDSRYIKVNPAYLRLVGRSWEELNGQSLGNDLPYPLDDPARMKRLHLLDTQGFYELAEVDMLHSSGRVIPGLISAQRRRIDGESFDIEIILDNSERKAYERAIMEAAFVDSMTGLQNRASFESYLRQALATLEPGCRITLAYIDLNRFKQVNDQHGHSIGDKLLRVIADRLRGWTSKGDFIARLGGDEFAIVSVIPAAFEFSALRFFDLGTQIAQHVTIDDKMVQVGAAIGIAEAQAGMTFDVLLDQADKLMYDAKSSGKMVDIRSSLNPVAASEFGALNYAARTG